MFFEEALVVFCGNKTEHSFHHYPLAMAFLPNFAMVPYDRATSYDPNMTRYDVYESSQLLLQRYARFKLTEKKKMYKNNKVVTRPYEQFVLAGKKLMNNKSNRSICIPYANSNQTQAISVSKRSIIVGHVLRLRRNTHWH